MLPLLRTGAPGTYQNATGSEECVECPVGFYQSESGKAFCVPCEVGRMSASAGASTCSVSPAA